MPTTYNLFVSHSWTYGDTYEEMIKMLDGKDYFSYQNFSVPQNDPVHTNGTDKQLYEAIKNKIQLPHVIVIMAGVYSTYSKWINKEIDIAQNAFSIATPILAVEPWGSEKTSKTVKDAADKIVGWNTDSIVAGIRELA